MRALWMLGLFAGATLALGACDTGSGGPTPEDPNNPNPTSTSPDDPENRPEVDPTALLERVKDYNEALRTASLKLVRQLPTLEQIKAVQNSADPRRAYEEELDKMLESPRFTQRMIKYWRDVMRLGGGAADGKPSRDTAPTFAAQITVEGRPFTELFTSAANNCPTYDGDSNSFAPATCASGAPAEAGVLTNPGMHYQFYGNMAFRRVRWLQEVFVCTKFPAEYSDDPVTKGAADYVSPWPFESIATAPIDFQDTKSVICANCHTTINHIAPLFGNFDENGMWQQGFAVKTPLVDPITTELSHWLQPGEVTSWRLGEPVAGLAELGQAVADDPDVHECVVSRLYNFAMSKEDIVNDLATVPYEVLDQHLAEYYGSGMSLKATLREIFTSSDFVRF